MKKTLRKSLSWLLSVVMIFGVFTFVGHPIYFAGETALQNTSSISSTIFVYGGNVSITCSASGSTGCYEYSVSLKKTDDTQWTTLQKYGKNTTLNFTPPEIADYNICVKVKDNTGAEIKKFFVLRHTKDLVNNSSISSMSIRLGETVNVVASAVGGKGNYQYAIHYKKSTDAKWTTVQNYSSNNTVIVKPMKTTLYDICVSAKDSTEMVEKRYFTVNVLKPIPLENISEVDVTAVQLGKSFTVSAAASGGISPYTYAVYYKKKTDTKWTTAQNYNSNSTVKVTPMKNTAYDICVKVKDNAGAIEEKLFAVSVTNGVLSNTSTISDTEIALGNSLTVRASAKGGVPPYNYAVQYKKVTDTKWTTAQSYGTQAIISVKPVKTVTYDVCVKVKDSNNSEQKKYFTVPVVKNMTAHKMQHIVYKSATCTNNGNIEYWYCSDCQKYFKDEKGITEISLENTIIKAVGHTVVIDPAVAPTDTTEGHTEGSHCSVCGEVFTSPEIIPIPKPEEYTITYNIVGNDNYLKKLEISNPNRTTYTKNDDFSFQPITIEGYEWAGWFDASGEKVTKIQKGTTGDMTLWAKFEKYPYTVTFDSPLVPYNDTNTLTRYVSDTTPLRDLEWTGYVFMGWSDDTGKIIREIKPGTTNIKVHANWTSNRNQTKPNDYLKKEPIIIDNSQNGQYLFIYDIGTIINVPLYTIRDFGNAIGMKIEESYTTSVTMGKEEAKSVNETVANATTKSSSWILSKDWNELVTEIEGGNQTITNQTSIAISDGSSTAHTDNYNENNGNSNEVASKSGTTSKTISKDTTNDTTNDTTGGEIGFEAGVKTAFVETKVSGKITNEHSHGHEEGHEEGNEEGSSTEEAEANTNTWNEDRGYSNSFSTSHDKTISNSIANSASEEWQYSISKSIGGSNSESTTDTISETKEKSYASAFSYTTQETETRVSTWSNEGAPVGWYRLVCAGKVHVFAVVGYDIASKNYFVYTYSVLDDETYDFYDYSKNDPSYSDYNNGVLPFEVPVFVNEYVTEATMYTKGLTIERATGIIDGYNGESKNVWIPDNFVIDNDDGTYDIIQVKGIKANVFQGNSNINSVRLSSYITNIPDNAFKNCTSLKHIYSNNLENIGNSAFANCLSLVDVEHDNLKSIGNNAFDGCTQLADFDISSKVQSVGNTAFNGVNKVTAEANNANVVSSIAKCGAKSVTIDLGKMSDELRNVTITTNIIDNFTLNGKGKTLYNVSIESSAKTTTLSRITFTDNQKTPLRINSQNVNLNQVNITNSTGMTMILESENTNIYLRGINTFTTTSKNAVLCKNISVALIPRTNETTKLSVPQGDILVCGDSVYSSLLNASIRTISQSDFENMISSHIVYFNANGGSVPTQSKSVAYNSTYGTLPTPTRDYHWFDGWFTAQNGGVKVSSDDIFTGDGDITLYAHWTQKDISNWVLESNVPSGAMIKDTKWTYDLTTTTTSSNSYLYGYTLYNTTWYWSDYGAWSGWQNEAVYGSESREVSTRYIEPTYKTQYNYNRWKSNAGHNWGPCKGTWSGVYCPNYEERGWTDDPLPYVETRYSPQIPGNFNIYGDNGANAWYNEWTRQVQTGGGYTQYTYRDRYKIYTYYFKKVESKESSTEVRTSDSISNVNKWVRYIEK